MAGEARSSWRWAALWGLCVTLVRTDFKARYHATLGGFVWALLKPTLMFLVLMTVFSLIFDTHPNYALHLIIGLFLWDFFSEGTKVGLTSLHARGYLVAKAHFPRWIVVVTCLSNPLLTLLVFAVAVLGYLFLFGPTPTAGGVALFAAYLGHLLLIVIGFSLGTSALFLRYRDLNQLWDVAIQAGFFVAPVIYPIGILPERFHFLLYLWLPTPFIQFTRSVLVDGVTPTPTAHLLLVALTLAVLLAGAAVFRAVAPRAIERL